MAKNLMVLCAGASLALGVIAFGEAQPALASCITWQGGQTCDTPAPRMNYHYQAPTRTYRGGGYSGGGGGNRAAAAIGAAGVAIGVLGIMMEQAAEQERNAADEESRRRARICQGRYRQAYALNERGKRMSEQGQPEEAFQLFERAYSTLGHCGTRTDLAKLRGNIDNARSEFARWANPELDKSALSLSPGLLDQRARGACKAQPENSPAWQRCMVDSAADAIMSDNAATRDACAAIADMDRRNQCAFNRYGAALNHQDPNQFGDPSNCYWDEHGQPCHPGGRTTASADSPGSKADSDPNSLRNQLRRALQSRDKGNNERTPEQQAAIDQLQSLRDAMPPGSDRDKIDATLTQLKGEQTPSATASGADGGPPPSQADSTASNAPPPAQSDTPAQRSTPDEAYQDYMNGTNNTTGGKNNGDLGHSGFSMSGSETRKEIDRLTAPPK